MIMSDRVKLNGSDDYEPIKIKLNETDFPIAYNNKIEEFVEEGLYESIEEAKSQNREIEIELELYYQKSHGLFAVESEAVESGTIYSPYNATECEQFKND